MTRLIDADALKYEPLPKGERNYRTYNLDDAYEYGYNDAFVDVRNAPTIDAEPVKHGKWVNDAMGVLRCSECKAQAPWKYGRDYIDYRWKANYCPNCGADMRGESDD